MSEKRFKLSDWCGEQNVSNVIDIEKQTHLINVEVVDLLNEQQATITAQKKGLDEHIDNIIALSKENEQLRLELDTHRHPLWSTREAERKLSEVTDSLANEVKKNGLLNEENSFINTRSPYALSNIGYYLLRKKGYGEKCKTKTMKKVK